VQRGLLGLGSALLGRLLAAVATLLCATGLLLGLLVLAPGDPISQLPNAEELRPQLEVELGLDRSPPIRWLVYLGRLCTLDLGTSWAYRPGAPVLEVIWSPAQRSLLLVGSAFLLVGVWGTALAFVTGGRRSPVRGTVQLVSLVPTFLMAYASVIGLNTVTWWAVESGYIDRPSWFALPDEPSLVRSALAVVVLAVGSGTLSEVHGEIEDALVRMRTAPWVDAARARGQAIWPLVLRGLAPQLVSTLASRSAVMVGGVVVVEKLLLLNGAGAILWEAAGLRDHDLAMSIGVLACALVVAVGLCADGLRVVLDPRLREP
jgi:ABC-type dipeptide/oligopeptide/nickel transport system permease component